MGGERLRENERKIVAQRIPEAAEEEVNFFVDVVRASGGFRGEFF
jgi:hypothetical protein